MIYDSFIKLIRTTDTLRHINGIFSVDYYLPIYYIKQLIL